MKKKFGQRQIRLCLLIIILNILGGLAVPALAVELSELLQIGAQGVEVRLVQEYLYGLGYLEVEPTGYYGEQTAAAVKTFQMEHSLPSDGKTGLQTFEILRGAFQTTESLKNLFQDKQGSIKMIPWSLVNRNWEREQIAVVTDLKTGYSFRVKRQGGYHHVDAVPLTVEDTRIMLRIYNNQWSWERRAVAVQLKGEYVAASINGMPHGEGENNGSNFQGHFCIHFQGSRLHLKGELDLEHQKKVQEAVALFSK